MGKVSQGRHGELEKENYQGLVGHSKTLGFNSNFSGKIIA